MAETESEVFMVKTVFFAMLLLLLTYLVIGIIKTLFYYVFLYIAWKRGGQKPIRGTCTTIEVDEKGNDIAGTEKTEEVIYDSPYEALTHGFRERVYEAVNDKTRPTLAYDIVNTRAGKIIILLGQFISEVLTWPSAQFSFSLNRSNKAHSE